MALKPAIYKRADQVYGYNVILPASDDPCGPHLQLNLTQPFYDNAVQSSCKSYGALAIGPVVAGHAYAGKIGTLLNGGLTKTSGVFAANNHGQYSGHYSEYTVYTNGQVTYVVPAGHDTIAVTMAVPTNVKASIVVALDGVTLENIAYGTPAYLKLDTKAYHVVASDVDRDLTITCGAGGSNTFSPIAVRSWDSQTLADPRDADAFAVHRGASVIEYVVNSRAAVSSGNGIHAPNTFEGGAVRMCGPNVWEPIISCDPAGGTAYKWTALGYPHYAAADSPYLVVDQPQLYVDGSLVGNMVDSTIPYGQCYTGDNIIIVQSGTNTGAAINIQYVYSISPQGLTIIATWGFTGAATIQTVYGWMISGAADALAGLAQIRHYVRALGETIRYPTATTHNVLASVIDVEVDGAPLILRVTNHGPGSLVRLFNNFNKVYTGFQQAAFRTPADRTMISVSASVRPMTRERGVLAPVGAPHELAR